MTGVEDYKVGGMSGQNQLKACLSCEVQLAATQQKRQNGTGVFNISFAGCTMYSLQW